MTTAPPIGIDLGTTFSVVAYLDNTGRPLTIKNADGDVTTPSVVFFDDESFVVGKEAVKTAALEPELVAQFAKRDMGETHYHKTINDQAYPPEVIQAIILRKVKQDAELMLGTPIRDAVVTVPAFFNEPRRKATQDAARLAGLHVPDIINEPTAAAIAYGVQKGFLDQAGASTKFERILIYDLGGGTFDVTIMEIDGDDYQVVATDGNVKLGGLDFDQRVADFIAEKFREKNGIDPREDPSGEQRLLREAEDAKRALSVRTKVTIAFEHRGMGVRVPMTRDQFDERTADLLERTRFTVENLMRQAGKDWNDITRLILVGGSTRMPMVENMLQGQSGMTVDRTLAADEAVAHGAAIYAGLLREDKRIRQKITDVNAHSLGVLGIEKKTGRQRNEVLIPANTPLPANKSRRFVTAHEDQRSVAVKIVEGGDAGGHNSTPIGECIIRDLPPGLPANTPVIVKFAYTSNGRLIVRAKISDLQNEAQLEIHRDSGMTDSDFKVWAERLGVDPTDTSDIDQPAQPSPDEMRDANSKPPDQADLHLRLAETLWKTADDSQSYSECLTHAAKAVDLRPDDVPALRLAARASWKNRDLMACLDYAQRLYTISTSPQDKTEACRTSALVYMEEDEFESAIEALDEALTINDKDSEAMSYLAKCYSRQDRSDDARQMARRCLSLDPDDEFCASLIRKKD